MTTETIIQNLWINPDDENWITVWDPDKELVISWGLPYEHMCMDTIHSYVDREPGHAEGFVPGTIKNGCLVYRSRVVGMVKLNPLPDDKKKELLLRHCIK